MRTFLMLALATIAVAPVRGQDLPPGMSIKPAPAELRDGQDYPMRSALFIAPSGKPFRAGPGDPYPIAAWFAQADTNRDGKLTMAELRDDSARFFKQLDSNGDGEIDPDEVHAYETVIAPEIETSAFQGRPSGGFSSSGGHHGGGGRGRHGGGGHRGDPSLGAEAGDVVGAGSTSGTHRSNYGGLRGAGRYGLLGTPEPVTAADVDFNRSITLRELQAKADRDFQSLDATGRGFLTLADLPKPPAQSQFRNSPDGHLNRMRRNGVSPISGSDFAT